LEARANSAKDMKTSTARLVWATWVLAGATVALVLSTVALIIVTATNSLPKRAPDELERRLQEPLDALPPAARAELLHVLMLPDFDRVDQIGEC